MSELKLKIELLPLTHIRINVAKLFPMEWEKFSEEVREKSTKCYYGCHNEIKYKCKDLDLIQHVHKVWNYDIEKQQQKLESFKVVCKDCHEVLHYNLHNKNKDKKHKLRSHFMKVNNLAESNAQDKVIFYEHLEEAYELCMEKSRTEYKLNVDILEEQFNLAPEHIKRQVKPIISAEDSRKDLIGICPRCKKDKVVHDKEKFRFCCADRETCKFSLPKTHKDFSSRGILIDESTAKHLIEDGDVLRGGFLSKAGNHYNLRFIMVDDGETVCFKTELVDKVPKKNIKYENDSKDKTRFVADETYGYGDEESKDIIESMVKRTNNF